MAAAEEGRAPPLFSIPPEDLVNLVEHRDHQWIHRKGGLSQLAAYLQTSLVEGISADELNAGLDPRTAVYGINAFKYPPPKGFLRLMFEAFKDLTIIILCVAAVVSLAIGLAISEKREEFGYLEGIAIIIVVLVVTFVQAAIDRHKEAKFRQLNSVKDNYQVEVVRAARSTSIPADQLVVGDVVKVTAGDKLPADGILIDGSAVKTNESSMTGEPIDISKHPDGDAFLLSGTTVSEGVGHILIVAVGERSQWGVILKGLIVEPESTPLQTRLDALAWTIGKLGIAFASLTFLVSMLRWVISSARAGEWDATNVLEFFIDAVTIVVVAIPEGLPLAITLGLAFAMRKMMKDNNLVRRLEACETMGSATQLNADKTGTLTQNRMTVVEADWSGTHVVYEGNSPGQEEAKLSHAFRDFVSLSMAMNTQANLEFTPTGTIDHLGNKTECALLQHVHLWKKDYREIRKLHDPFRVYMFDSDKKSMSTVQRLSDSKMRVHTKGAPEILLGKCTHKLLLDGKSREELGEHGRNALRKTLEDMARRGLRTLMLTFVDVEHDENDDDFWSEAPDQGHVYLGIVGIKDPIRPETKEAIRQLKGAGVTVRMVTGDNPLTATYIAKEAGILDGNGIVMEGAQFRQMPESELEKVALQIQVLARSTPTDKLKLVRLHKKLGEVTSVTGDGTNDGPALKEADVGFALGIAGTEIAKEACDIVILDDNIQSMTKAVLWGRNVYESIRKFLQFQLVVNVVAVTLNFISACAGVPLPLQTVPLLWVNMIMDSMGALALATEPPRPDMLERRPYGRRAPLINREMFRNIVGVSIFQLVVSLVLQFRGRDIFSLEDSSDLKINSIIFNVFVFMQIGSEINSRRIAEKNVFAGIHRSIVFLIIITVTVGIQIAVMLGVAGTEVGTSIGIDKVDAAGWVAAVVLGGLILPWGWLVRCFPLDWCFGPTDQDPTEMSKLEKLLRLPKRKPAVAGPKEHSDLGFGKQSSGTDDTDVSSTPPKAEQAVSLPQSSPSPRIIRLRVFVHAVAFVNVMSRATLPRPGTKPSRDKTI